MHSQEPFITAHQSWTADRTRLAASPYSEAMSSHSGMLKSTNHIKRRQHFKLSYLWDILQWISIFTTVSAMTH